MYILKQNLLCSLILSFFSFQQNKILWSADTNSAWGFLLEIYISKRISIVCFRVIFISELVSRCCCSFPEEVRTGRNRLCWQNPFKKVTKWLKIKKRKYNFRKALPFLYQIGFSGSICNHLENGFEGSWTRHTTLNLFHTN